MIMKIRIKMNPYIYTHCNKKTFRKTLLPYHAASQFTHPRNMLWNKSFQLQQHVSSFCNTFPPSATCFQLSQHVPSFRNIFPASATHFNFLQHFNFASMFPASTTCSQLLQHISGGGQTKYAMEALDMP